jgi:hypothetical protein
MKRLQLFKSASDFAYTSLETSDPAALDIAAAQEFQNQKLESADYPYWKNCFGQARAQFLALAQQPAPSAQAVPSQVAPKPASAATPASTAVPTA